MDLHLIGLMFLSCLLGLVIGIPIGMFHVENKEEKELKEFRAAVDLMLGLEAAERVMRKKQ